jgi:hypothetical protein
MEFNITGENKPKYIVSSDTDSLFVNIGKILEVKYPDLDFDNLEEVLLKVRPIQQDIGEQLNKYQSILAKKLLNSDEHYFDLKPEFIFKKAYWSGKRRYAQHIVDQEGIQKNDIIMMGLDLMKSNFPALFRNFGEEILKDILFSKPKPEIDTKIMDFKSSLQDRPWKQLMKPSGVKKISDYIEFPPVEGEIFSTLKKRCPINTRGAIAYNDLLRYYKLNVKYPEFRIGDKMYLAYLNSNPYNLSVIGLNGYDDPPFVLEFIEKYIDKEGIFNSVFKNKIENLYNDLRWDLNMNPYREEFFDFG